MHHRNAVGDGEHRFHLVGYDHDGHLERAFQPQNQVIQPGGHHRVQPGGGLVAEEDLRVHRNRPGQAGAFLHPPGKLGRFEAVEAGEAHQVELHLHHDLDSALLQPGVFAQGEGHVVADGHGVEQRRRLEQHPNLAEDGHSRILANTVDVLPLDQHLPLRRPGEADHVAQQGALAAAGTPQDGQRLSGIDLEIHPLQHGATAVGGH